MCLKVLGLETGSPGSCFGHQIDRCSGACVGAESAAKHLLRAKLALAPQKLRAWPYRGAVALEETGVQGLRQWHVIDGWHYLGTVHPDAVTDAVPEVADGETGRFDRLLDKAGASTGFDPDVYRILARHLTGSRKGLRPWPPGRVDG